MFFKFDSLSFHYSSKMRLHSTLINLLQSLVEDNYYYELNI